MTAQPIPERDPEWWRQYRACRGEPIHTFDVIEGFPTPRAVALCASCPVQPECLADALAWDVQRGANDFLFCGGMTPRQRSKELGRKWHR